MKSNDKGESDINPTEPVSLLIFWFAVSSNRIAIFRQLLQPGPLLIWRFG